ncbi:MAG: hypothetical protein P9L92_06225 [Candidatus Electryonea clarkiae]|nr:hypothetical protein [Candidatus Electryonea clarkiae]MDP8287057.1 hypothetical protein [Candidatus Electryonea clarkiae]
MNHRIKLIAFLFLLPVFAYPSAEIIPDSLLVILEEAEIEAGEGWLDFIESQIHQKSTETISGDLFPGIQDTTQIRTTRRFRQFAPPQGKYSGRIRVSDPFSHFPGTIFRLRGKWNRWETGCLLNRDVNEHEFDDLRRIFISNESENSVIIGGDFIVNSALGWTIRSVPSFPAGYYAASPGRFVKDNIRPNLSTEEGNGFRGAAGNIRYGKLTSSVWGGISDYDSRIEDGNLVIYSEQGNHTESRINKIERINEKHLGGRISYSIRENLLLGTTLWKSSWDKDFNAENQPSRFRLNSDQSGAVGVDLNYHSMNNLNSRFEIVNQENGGWGGAILGSVRRQSWQYVTYGYRATQSYHTLHARPFLPFGTDPSGKAGVYTGIERAVDRWKIGGWWAEEIQEPGENYSSSTYTSGTRLYGRGPISDQINLDIRLHFRQDDEGSSEFQRRGVRMNITRDYYSTRLGFRSEISWDGGGKGSLLSVHFREVSGRGITIAGSVSLISQYGSGASLILVEPYGPGQFPVRRVTRKGIYTALYSSMKFRYGLRAWARVGLKRLEETEFAIDRDDVTAIDSIWMTGIEWRY